MHSRSNSMMLQARWSCEVMTWMCIDWLDMPKLTSLRTRDSIYSFYSYTFSRPRHITLESDSHPLWIMTRHAQAHRCLSSICIPIQGWRHNHRRYSLHPSLTNRHRSSCKSSKSEIEARASSLCHTQPTTLTSHPPQRSFSGIGESVIGVLTRK